MVTPNGSVTGDPGISMEQALAAAEIVQRAYEWYEASRKAEAARALEMAVLRHKTALSAGVPVCRCGHPPGTCSSCSGSRFTVGVKEPPL